MKYVLFLLLNSLYIKLCASICDIKFVRQEISYSISSENKINFDLYIQNSSDLDCVFSIKIKSLNSHTVLKLTNLANNDFVNYSLSSINLKLVNDLPIEKEYSGIVRKNTINHKVRFEVYFRKDDANLAYGIYQDILEMVLFYFDNNGKKIFADNYNLPLKKKPKKVIDLSIVKKGGNFNPFDQYESINFGDLTMDQEKTIDVLVKSNTFFDVRLSSSNNGFLVLEKSISRSKIAYNLWVNSRQINLSNSSMTPVIVSRGSRIYQRNEFRYNYVFKTKANKKAEAGTYKDTIIVEVISNE